MRGFRGKLFVCQKLISTGYPIRRHPARRSDGRCLRRPIYHETKPFQFYQLEITLKDDRLRVCRFKDDHVFCLLQFRKRQ